MKNLICCEKTLEMVTLYNLEHFPPQCKGTVSGTNTFPPKEGNWLIFTINLISTFQETLARKLVLIFGSACTNETYIKHSLFKKKQSVNTILFRKQNQDGF